MNRPTHDADVYCPAVSRGFDRQADALIAHLDVLAERLRVPKRARDASAPECSGQELFALNVLGRQGDLTMSDLAAALRVPLSTSTRIVDRLVDKGLVARKQVTADRRIVHVAFSARGRRINAFVAASRRSTAAAMLQALPPRQRAALLAGLAKLSAGG
jgi:DNA-binding MarR family transcriptional regulator